MERKNGNDRFIPFPSPPSRACSVCRNKMNEVCHTKCAPNESYDYFDPDMAKPLEHVPTLTFQEYLDLPGAMKGKWLFYQQTKILETLNGTPIRPLTQRERNRYNPSSIKGSVTVNPEEGATIYLALSESDSGEGDGS